jgi:thiamine kinase-like enzyme
MEFLGDQPVFVKYKPVSIHVLGTSWKQEVQATCLAQTLGLCPPLLWIDEEKQSMAFYFLKDARPYTDSVQERQMLCESLKKLHSLPAQNLPFIPHEQVRSELNLFVNAHTHQKWIIEASKLLYSLDSLKALFPLEMHPCHLDLWTPNIVCTAPTDAPRLWILDWEYAADCDPDYDLAVFILLDQMNQIQEQALLTTYGKVLSPDYLERMIYMKSLACLRIASWYATKSVICDNRDIDLESWIYLEKAALLMNQLSQLLAPKLSASQ